MISMSSKAFQPVPGPDGQYRRLLPGWRRGRVQGHLYEFPTQTQGHTTVTLTAQGVHVEDCPQCHLEQAAT
jgi:hypothetical protein